MKLLLFSNCQVGDHSCHKITLDGTKDPLKPGGIADHARPFVAQHEHRVFETEHNLPQEQPQASADAVIKVHEWVH